MKPVLPLLHSGWPKLYEGLALLGATGLRCHAREHTKWLLKTGGSFKTDSFTGYFESKGRKTEAVKTNELLKVCTFLRGNSFI